MTLKTLLSFFLLASVSNAAIPELVPALSSTNLEVQTRAQLDLHAAGSHAGRPGAEGERQAVCLEMCAALGKGLPPMVASQLIRNLQRIGGAESVPTLVGQLGAADVHVRDGARRALAVNPSPEAGQALAAQLKMRKTRDARETAGLIQAMGERKEAGASRLIVPYVVNGDSRIFAATVKALSRLDEPAGIQALAGQRAKETGSRKAMLDAALFETDRTAIFEMLYAENETDEVRAVALLGLTMNNGFNVAANAMASGNPALQTAVIEAASQRQLPKLHDLVAVYLDKLSPPLQVQAMGVLEFSGNRAYAKGIAALLSTADAERQDAAAQALARIGTAESVPALLSLGTMESRKALGVLNADGIDAILEKEAAKPGNGTRRAVATDALAMRGRRDLIPQFFVYAAENDEAVSSSAIAAIGLIGQVSDLEQLIELMMARESSPLSREILKSIVQITRNSTRQNQAVGILVAPMAKASTRSQALILQALAQIGNREALQPVVGACRSPDAKLQKQAVKLLGEWKNDDALPEMLVLASDESFPLTLHVPLMRGVSRLLAAQKKLDEPKAIQALETCRRADERKLIVPTLAKAKSPEAKAALDACLADPELKSTVEEALANQPQGGKKNGRNKGKNR